jgi:hypothetical protein
MQFKNSHLGVFMMLISNSSIADNLYENDNVGSEENLARIALSNPDWQVINDSVMGGRSLGRTKLLDTSLIFSGDISIENNGGFSSVYRPVSDLPTQFDSISLQVVGDGNLYQMRIRSQVDGYNLAYKLDFYSKKNIEQYLTFRLSDFQASFRGRIISGVPVLKAENVMHVGFLITNKQPISFALTVNDIAFYSNKSINE